MPLKADHPSNRLTDQQVRHMLACHAPGQPVPCQYCKWPGTFSGICMVCQSLGEAIERLRGSQYWLNVAANEKVEKRRNRRLL